MEVIFWASAFVFFVIAEIITIQLVSIWLAVGAFVSMLVAYFCEGVSFISELGIFIAVSAFFLAVTFPLMKKRRNKGYIPTNSELEKGKTATVTEEINMNNGTGRAVLGGVSWSAVPLDPDAVIGAGSVVTVEEVQGAKLIVSLKS